jgi:hypothetical protein
MMFAQGLQEHMAHVYAIEHGLYSNYDFNQDQGFLNHVHISSNSPIIIVIKNNDPYDLIFRDGVEQGTCPKNSTQGNPNALYYDGYEEYMKQYSLNYGGGYSKDLKASSDGKVAQQGGRTNDLNWYGPGGQINWFVAGSAAAGENVSGAARIGNNMRLYQPTISGRVFQGNQYVKTFSMSKGFNFLGKVSFGAAFTMDAIGVATYYQNPNSPNAVHPGKFAANTGVGLFGLTGIGTVPALCYFGIDAFYPGGVQGYSQMAGNQYNKVQGTSGEKVLMSTFH